MNLFEKGEKRKGMCEKELREREGERGRKGGRT
jgi:hypothetical protein